MRRKRLLPTGLDSARQQLAQASVRPEIPGEAPFPFRSLLRFPPLFSSPFSSLFFLTFPSPPVFWSDAAPEIQGEPGRQTILLRYGLERKQFVGLIYRLFLGHWLNKTTTADKCVNKQFTHYHLGRTQLRRPLPIGCMVCTGRGSAVNELPNTVLGRSSI